MSLMNIYSKLINRLVSLPTLIEKYARSVVTLGPIHQLDLTNVVSRRGANAGSRCRELSKSRNIQQKQKARPKLDKYRVPKIQYRGKS